MVAGHHGATHVCTVDATRLHRRAGTCRTVVGRCRARRACGRTTEDMGPEGAVIDANPLPRMCAGRTGKSGRRSRCGSSQRLKTRPRRTEVVTPWQCPSSMALLVPCPNPVLRERDLGGSTENSRKPRARKAARPSPLRSCPLAHLGAGGVRLFKGSQ